jgi:hypothetical protein
VRGQSHTYTPQQKCCKQDGGSQTTLVGAAAANESDGEPVTAVPPVALRGLSSRYLLFAACRGAQEREIPTSDESVPVLP